MNQKMYILLIFIICNFAINVQVTELFPAINGNHVYWDKSEPLTLKVLLTSNLTSSDMEIDDYQLSINFDRKYKIAGSNINDQSHSFPMIFSSHIGERDEYEITLFPGELSNGRYEIELILKSEENGTVVSSQDVNEVNYYLTVGKAGFISGALKYVVNDEFYRDYALIQPGEYLASLPAELEGIYTKGFCNNEVVQLHNLKFHVWKESEMEANLSVYFRYSNNETWESLSLTDTGSSGSGEVINAFFPDIKSPDEIAGLEDVGFSMQDFIDDLLYEYANTGGIHELEFFIELDCGDSTIRLPEEDSFQTQISVVDVPLGAECQAALLPIDLMDFLVVKRNDLVHIQWIVVNEIGTQYFYIERSNDGRNWESIFETESQPSQDDFLQFTYLDKFPLTGLSYYRLKQKDENGSYTYSKMKTVRIWDSSISLFPNPVSDYLYYKIEDPEQQYYVHVYDQLGRKIMDFVIPDPAAQIYRLDLDDLAAGNYIIKYINATNKLSRTAKFVKL